MISVQNRSFFRFYFWKLLSKVLSVFFFFFSLLVLITLLHLQKYLRQNNSANSIGLIPFLCDWIWANLRVSSIRFTQIPSKQNSEHLYLWLKFPRYKLHKLEYINDNIFKNIYFINKRKRQKVSYTSVTPTQRMISYRLV